jgi:hypothetical protein
VVAAVAGAVVADLAVAAVLVVLAVAVLEEAAQAATGSRESPIFFYASRKTDHGFCK